jgi:hypothetical protein
MTTRKATASAQQVQQQIPCGDDYKKSNGKYTVTTTADPCGGDNKRGDRFYAVLMIVILFEGIGFEGRFCTGGGLRGVSAYKTASIRFETPSLS